jgi:alkylation response protein AidB-like acyl-CoA dehydrogenase
LSTDELRAYRESFRTFLQRRVAPAYAEWRSLLPQAGDDGFLAPAIPEQYGGAGVEDPRFGLLLAEEAMLSSLPAVALALIGHSSAATAIAHDGADAQRSRWLPRLASGDALASVVVGDVLIEDGRVDGNAQFVIDGDLLLVVGAGLVERSAPGVRVQSSPPGVGLAAAGLVDVNFAGARYEPLPAATVLTDYELGLAVAALAGARGALSITVDYVLDRRAFGQPIASFQNTRHVLAQLSSDIDAAQAFVDACVHERVEQRLTEARAAALKLHCSELYGATVDAGLQLHGGYGYMMEYPIAHAYADARFWRLAGRTSEQLKERIADVLLTV